jgi:hypothetical protein
VAQATMALKLFALLSLRWLLASANVEKVIFVAPPAELLPTDASIDNLLLESFSEGQPSIRTYLNATFPTAETPKGTETWILLEELLPGRRYEVRICWLATVRHSNPPITLIILTYLATNRLLAISSLNASGLRWARNAVISEFIRLCQTREPDQRSTAQYTGQE